MSVDCIAAIASPSAHWLPKVTCDSLVQTPPLPQCEVCVVVPVRNESEMLESTLTALNHQLDLEGRSLDPDRYEIILLANNCDDDSAAIAHRFAKQQSHLVLHIVEQTIPAPNAHIGWVRKRLMDEAYNRLISIGCNRGVIASTDGDTRVASNWIAATLYEVECGADAVGGRIVTDRRDRAALTRYTRACHLREVGYRFLVAELEAYLDPDVFDGSPRHFQHYGASLAVTAEMYGRAGGIPLVRTSEDVALYQALMRIDANFRHSPLVRVTTSARQVGRAQHGLADQLGQWTAMESEKQPFWVESVAAVTTRLSARQELRSLWRQMLDGDQPTLKDVALPSNRLGISHDWLLNQLTQAQFFGALLEQIEHRQEQENNWQQRWSLTKIEYAINDLRLLLEPVRQQSRKTIQKQVR